MPWGCMLRRCKVPRHKPQQATAADSWENKWQYSNGSCIPHPSFLGLGGWHDGVLLRLETLTWSSTARMEGREGWPVDWNRHTKFTDAPALRGNAALLNIRLTEVPRIRKSSAPPETSQMSPEGRKSIWILWIALPVSLPATTSNQPSAPGRRKMTSPSRTSCQFPNQRVDTTQFECCERPSSSLV
jgi:hypothetical protein